MEGVLDWFGNSSLDLTAGVTHQLVSVQHRCCWIPVAARVVSVAA